MPAASPHLAQLGAAARPAGSAAAAEARRYCAEVLDAAGFAVRERPFEYSQFPGRWAMPTAGVVVPVLSTLAVASRAHGWQVGGVPVLWMVVALAACVVGVAAWIAWQGVLRFPVARAHGVNLEARRGSSAGAPNGALVEPPLVWLVAHIDSKWQPVSMLQRVTGVIVSAVGVVGMIVALMAWPPAVIPFLVALWIGAIPLLLSVVGFRNHGTLDNASGVATVLEAVALLPSHVSLGVLITDAEEMALAGAAAWASEVESGIALNCDSVDDVGPLVVMHSGPSPDVLDAFAEAAVACGEPVRVLRLIPGILTDHVALARTGWRTATLSRGTMRTLGRIHTRRDSLADMDGRGIAGAARVLARAAQALTTS